MGGHTIQYDDDTMEGLLAKFVESVDICTDKESSGYGVISPKGLSMLQVSTATLFFKNSDGSWTGIGNNGMEAAVTTNFNKEPKTRFALAVRFT
jgi:hypothetical protein